MDRLASVGTSLLCDALDECGRVEQYLGGLLALGRAAGFAGQARTIQFRVRPREEWFPEVARERMIAGLARREAQVGPGDVVVIASESEPAPPYAILGDLGAANYQQLGVAAVVTSGYVRDVAEIERLGLPVWAAGRSPVNGRGRARTVAMDQPVTLNGVTVAPGDWVVGDADGVIVIPDDAELHRALWSYIDQCEPKERATKDMIARGERLSAAFAEHGQL